MRSKDCVDMSLNYREITNNLIGDLGKAGTKINELKKENEQLKKELADYKNKDRVEKAWYGGYHE